MNEISKGKQPYSCEIFEAINKITESEGIRIQATELSATAAEMDVNRTTFCIHILKCGKKLSESLY